MAANIALTKFSAERIAIEIKASWKQERQRILLWRRHLRPVMSDDISLSFLFFQKYFVCKLKMSRKCPFKKPICKGSSFCMVRKD